MNSIGAYDGLRTFGDVKAMLETAASLKALEKLNDAVEERFMRDRQQLAMTDADWNEYSLLLARRVSQVEQ